MGKQAVSFEGSVTSTGRSEAVRLEKAFFRAHLEFRQVAHPERLSPFSSADLAAARELTRGVEVSDDDALPDDVTI